MRLLLDQIEFDEKSMELMVPLTGVSMNNIYHRKTPKEKGDSNQSACKVGFL